MNSSVIICRSFIIIHRLIYCLCCFYKTFSLNVIFFQSLLYKHFLRKLLLLTFLALHFNFHKKNCSIFFPTTFFNFESCTVTLSSSFISFNGWFGLGFCPRENARYSCWSQSHYWWFFTLELQNNEFMIKHCRILVLLTNKTQNHVYKCKNDLDSCY